MTGLNPRAPQFFRSSAARLVRAALSSNGPGQEERADRKWRRKSLKNRARKGRSVGPSIRMPWACRLRSTVDKPDASRPEMAPQELETIESAPGNGALAGPSIRKPAACRFQSAADKPNASRPEMAPQRLETIESAPGNGALAGPSVRMPAACRFQSAADGPNASRPETAPQGLEKIESAPGNGARPGRSIHKPAPPRLRSVVDRQNASRPGMAPQAFGITRNGPEIGRPRAAARPRGSDSPMKSLRRNCEGSRRPSLSRDGDLPWARRRTRMSTHNRNVP